VPVPPDASAPKCPEAFSFSRLDIEEVDNARNNSAVSSILPFIKPTDGTFDEEACRVMGEAFDAMVAELGSANQSTALYEAITIWIITTYRDGERDPKRLRKLALKSNRRWLQR
jgi:hypothetical protein